MPSTLTELLGSLAGDSLGPIARKIGADKSATRTAIAAALPTLLGALARNTAKPDGARSLHKALARDHDGNLLDNLGGFLGGGNASDGNGILRHTLGDRQGAVEKGISKASGLDLAQAGPLLAMLAPVVMGMIGRQQRERKLDASGLSEWLGKEREESERQVPGLKGLGRLLDRDGDGHIADDLFGGVGKSLLGSLLGGRR